MKVCILAAGKGTRNNSVKGLHKALLPLENKLITNGTKKQVNVLEGITEIELDQLRQQLGDLPSRIVAQFPSPTINNQNGNYPSHNIYLAQLLYPFCTKVVIDQDIYSNYQKLGLLYAQILHHFKIPTQLNVDQSGDLQVVFDSGLVVVQGGTRC